MLQHNNFGPTVKDLQVRGREIGNDICLRLFSSGLSLRVRRFGLTLLRCYNFIVIIMPLCYFALASTFCSVRCFPKRWSKPFGIRSVSCPSNEGKRAENPRSRHHKQVLLLHRPSSSPLGFFLSLFSLFFTNFFLFFFMLRILYSLFV